MEHHSVEQRVVILYAENFFGVFVDKREEFFYFFGNRFETHCRVHFSTLPEKFFAGEFLAETIENPRFLKEQVLLSRTPPA